MFNRAVDYFNRNLLRLLLDVHGNRRFNENVFYINQFIALFQYSVKIKKY